MRRTLELIAFFVALLLAAMAFHAWLAAHDEQQRLAATLATQKQLLDAADARERTRDAALNQTLAQIAQLKSQKLTPQEVIAQLPKYLPLPQPITLDDSSAPSAPRVANSAAPNSQNNASPASTLASNLAPQQGTAPPASSSTPSSSPGSFNSSASSASSAAQSLPSAPTAKIPAADLQPLFDFVQDCRACQSKLFVAQQNASDDAAKIAALTTERDAAITASKGGTLWRRFRRNLLWFAVGAGTGFAIAKR
jgi:hypothetical protein